jgi:hypothetical protein
MWKNKGLSGFGFGQKSVVVILGGGFSRAPTRVDPHFSTIRVHPGDPTPIFLVHQVATEENSKDENREQSPVQRGSVEINTRTFQTD